MSRTIVQTVRAILISLTVMLVMTSLNLISATPPNQGGKLSQLGQYSGYSTPTYTDWVRTSQYVAVRDGTKLAVDILRPAMNGNAVADKLPVLLDYERYGRAMKSPDGKLLTQVELFPFVKTWLSYGYVIVAADMRGTGASFGTRPGEFLDVDSTDAYDVIDWISRQPWSSGKVGMYGVSYPGMTQWMAAGAAPSALKAIAPAMTQFDLYTFAYPGGAFLSEPIVQWANLATERLDKQIPPVPVDEDMDGSLAKAAQKEHQANAGIPEANLAYRDSPDAKTGGQPFLARSLYRFLPGINKSGVAVYGIAGWYDGWARENAAWFNNLSVPKRVIFTPFDHVYGTDPGWQKMSAVLLNGDFKPDQIVGFMGAEYLRFFDYTLKGIDNGIMKEPPVWYYTLGAPAGQAWHSSEQWPLVNQVPTKYYFQVGPSQSIASTNDGLLNTTAPTANAGQDDYTVDYTTTMGTKTRWQRMVGGEFEYGDMTAQGKKSLTYTTSPLANPLEITGHPIVHLWVSSSADDGDFFVYLEKVDATGYAHSLTEGVLRASHRALAEPPYQYMGLPYHRSFKADIKPLPKNTPAELVFDLLPTSVLFQPGERIRIRIVGADADTFQKPKLVLAPTVSIYRSAVDASYIELPVIPAH